MVDSPRLIDPTAAPVFHARSRLLLIAPHPDDEALACSVPLQRAVAAGAAIQVVYATDGEDNPWPQRVLERKWRLDSVDRKSWAVLRRTEAIAALRTLGVDDSGARFLGFPDQGLTRLLVTGCESALEKLAATIIDWNPTDLLVPTVHDTHPDHSALGVMLRLVLAQLWEMRPAMSVWAYLVHGQSKAFAARAHELSQRDAESVAKKDAIGCHKTQLKLSRRRFLAYALRPERLLRVVPHETSFLEKPVQSVSRQSDTLHFRFVSSPKFAPVPNPTLFILGREEGGRICCLRMSIPRRSSTVAVFDCRRGEPVCLAQYRGVRFAGEFTVPLQMFSPESLLFVKLERRLLFFDETGWFEVPPCPTKLIQRSTDRAECEVEMQLVS
ncbi:MAG TPA: PIG-L family deacetylase [Candidatus Udaeobacter sp.]|nr:PIG-L family deacetylase [Candidatus Udaeobacter sp.]